EQLRLGQRVGDDRAVERDEGAIPSHAMPVHRFRQLGLAGPSLALDEDGRGPLPISRALEQALDPPAERLHPCALTPKLWHQHRWHDSNGERAPPAELSKHDTPT